MLATAQHDRHPLPAPFRGAAMTRPRILHLITDSRGISGAERIVVGLGAHADRVRFELAFCTVRGPGPLNAALAATGWPTYSLDVDRARDVPAGLARLARLAARLGPDILHAHLFHSVLLGAVVTAPRRTLLVQTRHYAAGAARAGSWNRRLLDAWAARRCVAVAAVSEAARDHLVDGERCDPAAVRVIENGVDCAYLAGTRPDAARARLVALGVGEGRLLGCAASFNRWKGHDVLVAAFAALAARFADLRLVLLGRGELQPAVEADVQRRGLAARVHFLGHRDDALDLLAGFDIYAQPSVEEGFGLAPLEAMATARPTVVSDVGGMARSVLDGTGLRVPPGDPAALVEALATLLDDPARAAELGRRGARHVHERYSLEGMVHAYQDWYEELLGGRR
jgi:glycosyltransferase involved in cell wall biosynthesis